MSELRARHAPIAPGQKFGRLTALGVAGRSKDGHVTWTLSCECGNQVIRQSNNLRLQRAHSCGCAASDLHTKHGGKIRGVMTPEYSSWCSMVKRCYSPTDKDYHRYGERGVSVCENWRGDFAAFLADMGERPPGTTLDRWPDANGDYSPENCRWATPKEQARNRRNTTRVLVNGKSVALAEIAEQMGITVGAAHMRLKRGKLHV